MLIVKTPENPTPDLPYARSQDAIRRPRNRTGRAGVLIMPLCHRRDSSIFHLSSFPPYETPDDTRTSTPEPIKVVRSKKKATSGDKEKKKKRSTTVTSGAANA